MHNALSFERVHQPKTHTLVTYHPETNMGYAYNPRGPHFTKMGQVLSARDDPFGDDERRGQRMWLLPEEVIYLLERGTADVRWPATADDSKTGEGNQEAEGLPMSLQGAYAMFLGDEPSHQGALTFERYSVYSGLKRMGYTVHRAPTWDAQGPPLRDECFPPLPQRKPWAVGLGGMWSWWTGLQTHERPNYDKQEEGPLVEAGLYRSYPEIYRRLALVGYHDPTTQYKCFDVHEPSTDDNFRIAYHVWKPGSPTYRKSAPGVPDFRIAVVDARETCVPTLEQMGALLETAPYSPPDAKQQMYQKLKHGYKNVMLAIVDQGVVSYLRIADAGFGKERLYDRCRGPGGKRGGRAGPGRGRGR